MTQIDIHVDHSVALIENSDRVEFADLAGRVLGIERTAELDISIVVHNPKVTPGNIQAKSRCGASLNNDNTTPFPLGTHHH